MDIKIQPKRVKEKQDEQRLFRIKMPIAGFYFRRKFYQCTRLPEGFLLYTSDEEVKNKALKLGGQLIE